LQRKALALLSGGLDSTLALTLVKGMGIEVEAVQFRTPFNDADGRTVDETCAKLGVKLHHYYLGDEYLRLVEAPRHGLGANMNPCIDCRVMMLEKAKGLAEEIGAVFFLTGEVLGQRPMSQHRAAMRLIEREAGVEGLVLRPLCGGLLDPTKMEEEGVIDRKNLLDISGRRRLPQMELAEKLGIRDYTPPAGGCLLTDPEYASRLRDYIRTDGTLTVQSARLLKLGRHFRVSGARVVVGRNEDDNRELSEMALDSRTSLEVEGYNGPTTLIIGPHPEAVEKAAALTVRYSDAPKTESVWVAVIAGSMRSRVRTEAMGEDEIESLRIVSRHAKGKAYH